MKKIILPLLVGFLVFWLVGKSCGGSSKTQPATTTTWQAKTKEQKQEYIQGCLDNPSDQMFNTISEMEQAIKAKTNFPEEVSWNERPVYTRAYINNAKKGLVLIKGSGTGKNAFGVKIGFHYEVLLTLTQDSLYIKNVDVFEN